MLLSAQVISFQIIDTLLPILHRQAPATTGAFISSIKPKEKHLKALPTPSVISPDHCKQVKLTAVETTYFMALPLGVLAYSCRI